MSPSSSLGYQVSLEFIFAIERSILLHHTYGETDISPSMSSAAALHHAALVHLARILLGHNNEASPTSTASTQDVRVATYYPTIPRPFWSLRLGTGRAGMEMHRRRYPDKTPFERTSDAHVCGVQLVSPVFADTDEAWTEFTSTSQRIIARLQQHGALREASSTDAMKHLAWTNGSCRFTVTVQPTNPDADISWSTVQNLQAAWGSCPNAIRLLQRPTHRQAQSLLSAIDKTAAASGDASIMACITRLFAIPTLTSYLKWEAHIAAQVEVSRLPLILDDSGDDKKCRGYRFDEHKATLDVPQIQFWTRFTHKALVACRNMAAKGQKFGIDTPIGIGAVLEHLVREDWVRDSARGILNDPQAYSIL